MRHTSITSVLGFWLFCLQGCTVGPDSNPCFDAAPWAVIGTGESEWEDLNSGDAVTMVHGPQGGWHILGSAKAGNMGQLVSIHYTIHDVASGARIANNTYTLALKMDDECSGHFPGMYAYLNVSTLKTGDRDTPPELLAYNDLELTMDITNEYGMSISETVQVIAVPDPQDIEESRQ